MAVFCRIMYTLLIGNTKHDDVTQNRSIASSKSFNVSYIKKNSSLLLTVQSIRIMCLGHTSQRIYCASL
jgi:hypothetical protein